VLVLWAPLALFSGYRAIVQVYSVELRLSPPALQEGATVIAAVRTSGRTHVEVVVELIQEHRVDTLAAFLVRSNRPAAVDPRTRSEVLRHVVQPGALAHLRSGRAIVRATATGRSQWMRTPPPTVRELRLLCPESSAAVKPAGSPPPVSIVCLQQHG